MKDRASKLKALKQGDLVYYRLGDKSESVINKTRTGIIIELGRDTAMGFSIISVLWNDTQEIDSIAENYLHKIDEA